MEFNDVLTLITEKPGEGGVGQQAPSIISEDVVACRLKYISADEFYNAGNRDLKPDMAFEIMKVEYSGQQKIRYHDKIYSVIRPGWTDEERIELICEEKVADGNSD